MNDVEKQREAGDEPLSDGYCYVEYYPGTRKVACKTCDDKVAPGEPRIGNRYRGPYNKGPGAWKVDWSHLSCVKNQVTRITQLAGWDKLRYSDQVEIENAAKSKRLGTVYTLTPAELEAEDRRLWQVKDAISTRLSADEVKKIVEFNGFSCLGGDGNELHVSTLLQYLADGIIFGTPDNCPACNNNTLTRICGRMVCCGWISGYCQCKYRGPPSDTVRFKFQAPSGINIDFLDQIASSSSSSSASSSTASANPKKKGKAAAAEEKKKEPAKKGRGRKRGKEEEEEEVDEKAEKKEDDDDDEALSKRVKKAAGADTTESSSGSSGPVRLSLPDKPKPVVAPSESTSSGSGTATSTSTSSAASSSSSSSSGGSSSSSKGPATPAKLGSEILKIDPEARGFDFTKDRVFTSPDGVEVYHAMLTKIDLEQDTNSFYRLQLIETTKKGDGHFVLFTKWGKTGAKKKYFKQATFTTAEQAIVAFQDKFHAQTANRWNMRYTFAKKPGKYNFIELSRGADDEPVSRAGTSTTAECTLEPKVQDLVELLWDQNTILEYMKSVDIDIKKLPLGKLSIDTIKKGFAVCVEMEGYIKDRDREAATGKAKEGVFKAKMTDACTRFYSLFPTHKPQPFFTMEKVSAAMEMLNVLGDIALAQDLLKEDGGGSAVANRALHPLDDKYRKMKCALAPLNHSDERFKLICEYVKNTQSSARVPKVIDIFQMDREGDDERFSKHSSLDNRKLLWHGTNIAVVVAICASGLRIMPHSGGRVGKGVYFASENGKSAAYVHGCKDGTAIMFLAEVALGKPHSITADDSSLVAPPAGFDSVIAQGRTEPDGKDDETIVLAGKNVVVPKGIPVSRSTYSSSSFSQTEYLVYQESQVRLRYMLKLKF